MTGLLPDLADLHHRLRVGEVGQIAHDFRGMRAECALERLDRVEVHMRRGHERCRRAGCAAGQALVDLGLLHRRTEALTDQRQGMAERFGPAAQWLGMSDGFARTGKTELAAKTLEKGLEKYPDNVDLWVGLEQGVLWRNGRAVDARIGDPEARTDHRVGERRGLFRRHAAEQDRHQRCRGDGEVLRGHGAELRVTPKGTPICQFSLAINRQFKMESGESREEVIFVDIEAWGKQGETIAKYCTKGRPLYVEGRLRLELRTALSWKSDVEYALEIPEVARELLLFSLTEGQPSLFRFGAAARQVPNTNVTVTSPRPAPRAAHRRA